MAFNFASGRNFIEMLAHTVLATHAGVCRGPRFSSLPRFLSLFEG